MSSTQFARRRLLQVPPLSVRISIGLVLAALIPLVITFIFISTRTIPALIDQSNNAMANDAQTRVQLLDNYLNERIVDVQTIEQDSSQVPSVQTLLLRDKPNSPEFTADIIDGGYYIITSGQVRDKNYAYWSVFNANGQMLLLYPPQTQAIALQRTQIPADMLKSVQTGKISLSPVYYDPDTNKASIDIYAPIFKSSLSAQTTAAQNAAISAASGNPTQPGQTSSTPPTASNPAIAATETAVAANPAAAATAIASNPAAAATAIASNPAIAATATATASNPAAIATAIAANPAAAATAIANQVDQNSPPSTSPIDKSSDPTFTSANQAGQIAATIAKQAQAATAGQTKVIGVLRATLNLDHIWDVVQQDKGQNGSNSYAFITDENGVRIADTNENRRFTSIAAIQPAVQQNIIAQQRFGSAAPVPLLADNAIANKISNSTATTTFQTTPTGQNEDYAIVEKNFSSVPWHYFVLSPISSETALAQQQQYSILVVGLLVACCVTLLGLIFGRTISRPIQRAVKYLRDNSEALSALATRQQDAASEQIWVANSSQVGLQSVQYYTQATKVALNQLHQTTEDLIRLLGQGGSAGDHESPGAYWEYRSLRGKRINVPGLQ